jgi:hypothetical protein
MVVGEGQRRALHQRLVEVLGVDSANVLMEHLPPSGWGDVARRSDLDHLERVLRLEIENTRVELRGEIAEMRGEMAELRGDLRAEMARQSRSVIVGMGVMVATILGTMTATLLTLR